MENQKNTINIGLGCKLNVVSLTSKLIKKPTKPLPNNLIKIDDMEQLNVV